MTSGPTKVDLGEARVKKVEAELGPDDPHTIGSRLILALELHMAGRMHEAEQVSRGALESCLRTHGPEHQETVRARSVLVTALHKQHKYAEAQHQHELVLSLRTRTLGPQHADTLASRCNRARILHDAGHDAEAREEAQALLEISTTRLALGPEPSEQHTLQVVHDAAERLVV